MSATTSHERRRKTLRRFIVIGVLLALVAVLIFSQVARADALALTGMLENLKDARGATATIAITVLVILAIVENAEKLHFMWEMGHKLLGYDLESMAKHEREFTELPDDYIRRPEMERQLVTELAPGHEPKLVVFTEAHDTGKTTIMHYVIPRHLNRPYHGNVINCWGDLQSVEGEIGEDEEHRRRRLTKRVLRRVIQHAEVPGDVGETIQSMSDAITDYFTREGKKPWLIIIDQVDSPNFPYGETLPALFGQCNTVVVVSNRVEIEASAYTVPSEQGEQGEQVVQRRDLHLQPFTADEALAMFRQEVKKRHGTLPGEAAATLKTRLAGAWPGGIQRLSDIFVNGGGVLSVERALDPAVTGVRQAKTINATIVKELPDALRNFLVGLALLAGDDVGEATLRRLAATELCKALPFSTLISECVSRQYLAPTAGNAPSRKQTAPPRYTITKLGGSIARLTLRMADRDVELRLGSALLEFYRGLDAYQEGSEIQADLPNILGMMSWAESISCLPDRDVIRFTRHIREALYRSGQWDVGLSWLSYSEKAALRLSLFRSVGELATTRAQLLLASGKATSALEAIEVAHRAFAESVEQGESDLRLGSAPEELLRASLDYDALQRCWLTHLQIAAQMALLPARQDVATLEPLAQSIADAADWLSDTRAGADANARIAQTLSATLMLDKIWLALRTIDASARRFGARHATEQWSSVHEQLKQARSFVQSSIADTEAQRELMAQIERAEAALDRRHAAQSHLLVRLLWYVRANQRLTLSLQFAKGLRFEETLTRLDSAELQLVGITSSAQSWKALWYQLRFRRAITRFLPRWYRLRAAYRQLLKTNADSAALGAQAMQFSALMALRMVTRQLGRLERNPTFLHASDEYMRSAESIAQRLHREIPNLLAHASTTYTSVQSEDTRDAPLPPHDAVVPVGL